MSEIEKLSTDELVEKFKEATRHGKPPQELVNEMKKRPGIAFLNPTRNTEDTMAAVRAAIKKLTLPPSS